MPSVMQLRRRYERENREAAAIIARAPERYAGLTLDWARRILEPRERAEGERVERKRGEHEYGN